MREDMEVKTNIVVVCWNALDYTRATLDSLFATVHHPYMLTIVDNSSVDGTQEYLAKLQTPDMCKKYTLILNKTNLGYGGAINQGYEVSLKHEVDYTCVCNNDLYFQNCWLEMMERQMDKLTEIGILGVLRPAVDTLHHTHKDMSAKAVVDSLSTDLSITTELQAFQDGYSFEDTAKMLVKLNGGGVQHLRCPPNAVVTCCALIRNGAVKEIGYIADPRFLIYGSEDLDLSWSLEETGYKCAIFKDVYVHHFRHKSVIASGLDRNKYLKENNARLYNKWQTRILAFLDEEKSKGVDILSKLSSEEDP